MKKGIAFLVIACCSTALFAQQQPEPVKDTLPPVVVVEKDPRIDVLAGKKIATGDPNAGKGKTKVIQDKFGNVLMPGYRLQVLNSSDRNLVYRTKAMLYQRYPGNGVYVVSQAPFFKLRFGNFTSKEEAEKFRKILSPSFPAGVYVITDIIEARIKKPAGTEKKKEEKED